MTGAMTYACVKWRCNSHGIRERFEEHVGVGEHATRQSGDPHALPGTRTDDGLRRHRTEQALGCRIHRASAPRSKNAEAYPGLRAR
ncbi:MAG: hypothetical protein ACYTG6_07945 [Planctomycetota bacterium]|jgi:hypothetical protein